MEFRIGRNHPCRVVCGEDEADAVKIAAENLRTDLKKVFGEEILSGTAQTRILIRTAAEEGAHRERYRMRVGQGELYIEGSDRRGTVYGIYELSREIGVSPWYFWADVPVKRREEYRLPEGFLKEDYPSVEYRGIFINDEEELEAWVKNRMGEDTIGVKTYGKVFELLLRLKANYIWPAMHVNSFNAKRENGELAERMGIVVGTSHCDMLMRSNNREWKPWLAKKGYENVRYDYSRPGRDREILKEYWRESVEQNRDFEVCYTIGMRGVHDSGFETAGLKGMTGEELQAAKIELLQTVMSDQQEILREELSRETMMTFVPYKEVLPLYDGGLKVPEDVTLVWANDNYGYIRRFPSPKERERRGGNGIYYHNSYWAPPGMSYVFLCSIPLAHTANELRKAYAEGVRKLWVMNVGAMKPLEQEIEFFLSLAWEIGREGALTDDVDRYVEEWIDGNFSGGIGRETAALLNDFSQITNMRKVEMMDSGAFSQTAYGDEAVVRIHAYERMFEKGNRLYRSLPVEERDAFFQMALMRIHAAYFTNLAYYYGDRSTLMYERGQMRAASEYVRKTRELEDARRRMVIYYNKIMAGGKWNGILNPEGFPPPRAAMMPVCTPPLGPGDGGLRISLWNGAESLTFSRPAAKWLELGNGGEDAAEFEINAPDWVTLSENGGSVGTERRVFVSVKDTDADRRGTITVTDKGSGEKTEILVETVCVRGRSAYVEDGGIVVVEASAASCRDFKEVKRLGRGFGSLAEACAEHEPEQLLGCSAKDGGYPCLQYPVFFTSEGAFIMEIHRFPSLNSTGHIRVGVSVDGGTIQIAETEANDEHRGAWRDNVRDNVDRLTFKLPYLKAGEHRVCIYAVDRYFAFSRFVIYTGEPGKNNFAAVYNAALAYGAENGAKEAGGDELRVGLLQEWQRLPLDFDAEKFAEDFYGGIKLLPRPLEYASFENPGSTLNVADRILQEEAYGERVLPAFYLGAGENPFAERDGMIRIDAACVLSHSENAWAQGAGWRHCGSESYGRSGLAMYIREPEAGEKGGAAAPSLNYRIQCLGGEYVLWLLLKFGRKEEFRFDAGVDGRVLSQEELFNGGNFWRYEAEQIYRYLPVARLELTEGDHLLSVYAKAPGLRFDRICLVKGDGLPPGDLKWR